MKVCILGSNGLAGSGIFKALSDDSSLEILAPSSRILNLKSKFATFEYLKSNRPDQIIMAAGVVGGIEFNKSNQLTQFYDNRDISLNVIDTAIDLKIPNLLLISSSCIYPKEGKIPINESYLFSGLPEKTNEGYSIAKEMAARLVILARNELSLNWNVVIPTNLYGYSPKFANDSHVIPMLLRKFNSNPTKIEIWGDGSPVRQFLHNIDLGSAIKFLIKSKNVPPVVNVAPSESISVSDLVNLIAGIFSFSGKIYFDNDKDNGHPNKTLDTTIINQMGWYESIKLRDGLFSLAKESGLLVR